MLCWCFSSPCRPTAHLLHKRQRMTLCCISICPSFAVLCVYVHHGMPLSVKHRRDSRTPHIGQQINTLQKKQEKKIFMRVTHGIHAIRIVHGYTTTIHSGVCVICGARIRASSFYMYVPCVSCRIRLNRFRTKLLALRRRLAIVSET